MALDGFNNRPADPVSDNSGLPDHGDLLSRIGSWDRLLDAHWSGWRREALIEYDFEAGRQWTRDEIAEAEELTRYLVVFNRIAPTIDAVSGAEISNRQQVQYFPRQTGDSMIDDILTQGAEWIMDECEGTEEDSAAFRDALICGIGVTETRPDFQQDSRIIKERVDPLEVQWDASSRKACFADARYLRRRKPMSKEAFKELWPEAAPEGDHDLTSRQPVIVDPRIRYDGTNEDDTIARDEVVVREYQWYDNEPRFLVGGPEAKIIQAQWPNVPTQDNMVMLTPEQHDELKSRFPQSQTAQIKLKVYYRAFVAGGEILETQPIEAEDFTYKAMTGKRDRNKGYWFGLVRPMMDPQKWANKFFSQILHIMRTNAQGGVVMEEGAALDQKEFEQTWADPTALTIVAKGALSGPNKPAFQPKPTVEYPAGLEKLMETAVTAIRDVTGVNNEMLGSADRMQPGVLEAQRKQQAYGILAAFFDGKRRYHKMQGRLLLKMMSLYLPPDKLVRVTGLDDNPQYVPLALNKDAREYDVVVDEAPAGPNQKQVTFQILLQLMPLLQNAGLGADVWAEIARTSPLPAKVAELIATDLLNKEKAAQQAAPQQQALAQGEAQAKIANEQGSAAHHQAQAQLLSAKAVETHVATVKGVFAPPENSLQDEETQAKINLDRAKTSNLVADVVRKMEEPVETKE
jgi:hypothetical protein